jgi:hypothetical protein
MSGSFRVRCCITISLVFNFNTTDNLNGRLTCGALQVCVSELTLRIKTSMIFYKTRQSPHPVRTLPLVQ